MLDTSAGTPKKSNNARQLMRMTGQFVSRKVWLPRWVYMSLPYFYVLAGVLALLATVYISEWFWVLPHYLLFSVGCVHLGVLIFRRRRRNPQSSA